MSETKSRYPGWQVVQWTTPAHSDDGKGIVKRYIGSPYPTRALARPTWHHQIKLYSARQQKETANGLGGSPENID